MKIKKIVITITLSIISLASYSQQITNEPIHKETNAVLIISEMCNQQELFDKMAKILIQKGYGIRTLEKDYMYFKTGNKKRLELKTYSTAVSYELLAHDNYIKIKAKVNADKALFISSSLWGNANYVDELGIQWEYRKSNALYLRTLEDIYQLIDNLDVLVYIYYTKDE